MDWTFLILVGSVLWVGYRVEKLHQFFIEWQININERLGTNDELIDDLK